MAGWPEDSTVTWQHRREVASCTDWHRLRFERQLAGQREVWLTDSLVMGQATGRRGLPGLKLEISPICVSWPVERLVGQGHLGDTRFARF